jgi:hypothetical protein
MEGVVYNFKTPLFLTVLRLTFSNLAHLNDFRAIIFRTCHSSDIGLSSRGHKFSQRESHLGFAVREVAQGQVPLEVLKFTPANHHSSNDLHLPVSVLRCATGRTSQHITITSVASWGYIWHLGGPTAKKFGTFVLP